MPRTEEQLPLPIVSESDLTVAEGVLYFGTAYVGFLRSCKRAAKPGRGGRSTHSNGGPLCHGGTQAGIGRA
jgi:hypothetical protein